MVVVANFVRNVIIEGAPRENKMAGKGQITSEGLEKTIIERGRRRERSHPTFRTTKGRNSGENDVTSCEKASYLENMEERQVE